LRKKIKFYVYQFWLTKNIEAVKKRYPSVCFTHNRQDLEIVFFVKKNVLRYWQNAVNKTTKKDTVRWFVSNMIKAENVLV